MLEVRPADEICVCVQFSQNYDLLVAKLTLSAQYVGEFCFPVASVLPNFHMEDRDVEGIFYVSPSIGFDIRQEGAKSGRATISFETMNPPPDPVKVSYWCGFREHGQTQDNDIDLTASDLTAVVAPRSPPRPISESGRSFASDQFCVDDCVECRGTLTAKSNRKLGHASKRPKAEWKPSDGLADEPAASMQERANGDREQQVGHVGRFLSTYKC